MEELIYLWDKKDIPLFDAEIDQPEPLLKPYIAKNSKACIVICPGGGYTFKCDREGERYAEWLMENGISSFVLEYRVAPYKYPAPQYDAIRAIRYARYYADKYGYDKDKIGIMGSSAGGHLAGSIATATDDMGYKRVDEIDDVSFRPDFMALCYPVVSMTEYVHQGSRTSLLGEVLDRNADKLSVDKRVTENTPPAFIWHVSSDPCVTVENSLLLVKALVEKEIPVEFHAFQNGTHGIALAQDYEATNEWGNLFLNWLKLNHLK